jgi:regulator of protease activity HflC (stomatin/prohibitin superfamily)
VRDPSSLLEVKMKVVIGSTERGILYKDKQFKKLLGPGTYRYLSLIEKYSVEVVDIVKNPELKGGVARVVFKDPSPEIDSFLLRVSTGPREVAVVYDEARAMEVLRPSEERLFWRGLSNLLVRKFDIRENYQLDRETMRDIALIGGDKDILSVKVPEQSKGVLMEAGVIIQELSPGMYAFWRAQREPSVAIVDTRLTAIEVSGQDMLTKDKVSIRVNLAASYRVVDPVQALRSLSDVQGELYRTAQLALRQAVGERTLDELLESKEALNRTLSLELASGMTQYGLEVPRVGVKDIILPGDMRVLLNQVVEAEKAAQALNIRRREETAATRSLLNTAKMIENNPTLLRLKELETVERISDKVDRLTVYDGLQGVMNGLVSLKGK